MAAQLIKNVFAMQETPVWFLGKEIPLEEGMTAHSSILAWRIPMDRGALVGYNPGGRIELGTTELLTLSLRYFLLLETPF